MEHEYTNKLGPFATQPPSSTQPSSRPWLKPVLIGGGILAAIGIAVAIVKR